MFESQTAVQLTEMFGLFILAFFFLPEILIFVTEIAAIVFGYHVYTNEGSDVSIVLKDGVQLEDSPLEHLPKLRHLRSVTLPLTVALLAARLYAALV